MNGSNEEATGTTITIKFVISTKRGGYYDEAFGMKTEARRLRPKYL